MTIAPRWRKAFRDLVDSPARTVLAVLAMTGGVFGLGTILTAYSILARELSTTYTSTRPASAILFSRGVTDATVDGIRSLPGVLEAEARPVIRGRVKVGEDLWAPAILFVIRDFDDLRIDTFTRDAGAWPPAVDEILLERTALSVAQVEIGDRITVRSREGDEQTLRVAGTVHAAGLAPAWMDHVVSGFVGWRSVLRRDPSTEATQIRIVVAENRFDEKHIRGVAKSVRDGLEKHGAAVSGIDVPPPGRHPHADQMDTFLFLLAAFGALTFGLGAILVANMIHALLTKEVRQVGIMKAIGATTGQIVALYLGHVAILAAVSLCIGMPLGYLAGRAYADFSAAILNATLSSAAVPLWVLAVEIAVGIAVPMLVSLGPVHRASRITVHQALGDDVGRSRFGSRAFDRRLARIRRLPRPLLMSLRTTFHRRGRLALTVGTLAAGGAVFMSALNVSAAWTRAIDEESRSRRYDIDVRLSGPQPIARLAETIAALPDVTHAEYWGGTDAVLTGAKDPDHDDVVLVGLDASSTLLDLRLVEGRWLTIDDSAAVVINEALRALEPELHVGGDLELRVDDRTVSLKIVGVVKEILSTATAYAPTRAVLEATGQSGETTRSIRVVTRRHDTAAQLAAYRDLERALRSAGIDVASLQPRAFRRKALEDHLVIIASALILAAGLVILVGGLALTSTLTISVVERTREIGILSAIGATPREISGFIVLEGVLIGAFSWCVAVALAAPVTAALDVVAGQMFIKTPLDFFLSPRAAAIWFALVVILAAVSSFHPARRAGRLTVREALAHA